MNAQSSVSAEEKKLVCGIVMPISSIDGCDEAHWADVNEIISEAIEAAGFEANMVSNADDVGFIHKRIIQNLYDNPIVVCDVSGKNPNVMFELGMRLAFDKPTIIVKDDKTSYSFDTSAIEHIDYPRDLRFSRIVEFKQKLSEKIRSTHRKAISDSTYTTFLKHFGEFTVAKIEKKEVSGQEFVIEELRNLRQAMLRLERRPYLREREYAPPVPGRHRTVAESDYDICLGGRSDAAIERVIGAAEAYPGVRKAFIERLHGDDDHKHLHFIFDKDFPAGAKNDLRELMRKVASATEES